MAEKYCWLHEAGNVTLKRDKPQDMRRFAILHVVIRPLAVRGSKLQRKGHYLNNLVIFLEKPNIVCLQCFVFLQWKMCFFFCCWTKIKYVINNGLK